MNIEQLINNRIFCATTRIYAFLTEISSNSYADNNNEIIYVGLKEIMSTLDLSENTVRNTIRKLINNNLIKLGDKKHAFIINKI